MRKTTIILIAVLAVLIAVLLLMLKRISALNDEVDKQKANVETLLGNEKIYRICDSIKVAEINALQLDKDQYEAQIKAKDKQLQELSDKRKKDIEYYSKLSKTDTFWITKIDTFIVGIDSCYGYMDNYITYLHCPNETLITTSDTIKQVISKHYKHRFLWWKWKCDGFTQDVWTTNPHSNLHFQEFVKVGE